MLRMLRVFADARLRAENARLEQRCRELESERSGLAALADESSVNKRLADERAAELEVYGKQNRLLWTMHERMMARVARDTALLQREMSDAQNAAMRVPEDEE